MSHLAHTNSNIHIVGQLYECAFLLLEMSNDFLFCFLPSNTLRAVGRQMSSLWSTLSFARVV